MKIRHWIGRARYGWFQVFQSHRHRRLSLEQIGGIDMVCLPETMNPALFASGRILADAVAERARPGMHVLDMGTGTGIVGIRAAAAGASVVAIDINPAAVRCARINVILNQLETRMTVLEGDLFDPIDAERFDLVAFNPPFYRGKPRDAWETAWRSPDIAERFASRLSVHLDPGGSALVALSTSGDAVAFLSAFRKAGLAVEVESQVELGYERLTLHRVTSEKHP